MKKMRARLLQDALLIAASIWAAWAIVHFEFVHYALAQAGDGIVLASFLAGMFFTSLLTTAPAIAVLGELAQEGNLFIVAAVGALGSVAGDYLIFMFVRDRVSRDAEFLLKGPRMMRIFHVFKHRRFRRVLPWIGALIIASPFPDELGLALLGISKMRTKSFILISYSMNFAGIALIGLAARSMGW